MDGRHARASDPVTSHWAAEEASPEATSRTQDAILAILEHSPMTDTELIRTYNDLVDFGDVPRASESGIRSRRAELVDMGRVEASGEFRELPSGRKSIVWRLK